MMQCRLANFVAKLPEREADAIVAASPRGAMAHHMPTDTVIKLGAPVFIDIGAK